MKHMRGRTKQKAFDNLGVQPQAGSAKPRAGTGPSKTPPRPGELMPLAHPGRHFRSWTWQDERIQRAARICRCMDRGLAKGKKLGPMMRLHAWRWKDRFYTSDPKRPTQFTAQTLRRIYCRWKGSGGNPAALGLRYRPPVKLRPGQAKEFAHACVDSGVTSFGSAYGRLPRPKATWFAYRLALGPTLVKRVVRLFAVRRAMVCRTREARAALNETMGRTGR